MHHDMTVGEYQREKLRKQIDWETNGDKLYKAMEAQRKQQQDTKKEVLKNDCLNML